MVKVPFNHKQIDRIDRLYCSLFKIINVLNHIHVCLKKQFLLLDHKKKKERMLISVEEQRQSTGEGVFMMLCVFLQQRAIWDYISFED